ncbi:TetR/AcrR family transcriptional regulator [Psychromarinibacter sp. S121]|uniref:TetR/AcrR family transcriptional regulator n=1 Tax=Psychromarinibacter sp. S121 TaxID=3415127 RepID=UPI003C7AB10A
MARPKKQDAIDIKSKAIVEASALLREAPDRLSLSSLAKRIGCSAPALYAHFTNKDDLLNRVRERVFTEMVEMRQTHIDEAALCPVEAIRRRGHGAVDFAIEHPALYRLIFAPSHDASAHEINLCDESIGPITDRVRTVLSNGSAKNADAIARTIWFATHGAIMIALDGQLEGPDQARWERAHATVDTVIDLFLPSH